MFKAKLLKAVALGLCLSALYTGVAYAQSGASTSPSYGGSVEIDNALFEKQREIDIYLFKEHYEDIAKKDIEVVYTGVADTHVEIGISDYSEKKADYLYELFGKDIVKVVSTEEAQLYTTMAVTEPVLTDEGNMVAPDAIAPDLVNKDIPVSSEDIKEEIYTTMDLPMDAPLMAEDGDRSAAELAADSGMVDDVVEDDINISDESELIYHTTVADVAENGQEVQLVSARDDADKKDKGGLSAPATILIIAGGAAVIGGAVIVSNKKKEEN